MNKKTVYRWWWAWDFEREEDWLNEMALAGWVLDGIGFCAYHFVSCEPGEYTIRLEMHNYDQNYIDFMNEVGAEYIGRFVKWMYFRKKVQFGEFELFSDIQSRISHLSGIGNTMKIVGLANLAIGIGNSINVTHVGWINLLCATLLMYGLGRIEGKIEELKKNQVLME